jgi:hypothetical protein
MLCHVSLKLDSPLYCATTSEVTLQVLAMFYYMSLRYREKVLAFPLLGLGYEMIPIDVYHAVGKHTTLSHKYE